MASSFSEKPKITSVQHPSWPDPLFTFLTVGTNLNQQLAAYGLKMSTMLNVNIKTFLDQRKCPSISLIQKKAYK